jgi:hypothetical protein
MKYWPGTNIIKSNNNAFDWNTGESSMAKIARVTEGSKKGIQQVIEQRKKEGNPMYATPTNQFTVYSKAKAVRFTN